MSSEPNSAIGPATGLAYADAVRRLELQPWLRMRRAVWWEDRQLKLVDGRLHRDYGDEGLHVASDTEKAAQDWEVVDLTVFERGGVSNAPEPVKRRANWLGVPDFYNLNLACAALYRAFDTPPYLVGSALERRDHRDVDVRVILTDEGYDRLFPGLSGNPQVNAFWSLTCVAISEWLTKRTGLPIDFQVQKMSEANAKFPGPRCALGLFVGRT